MVLAESNHHAAPRGQKMARTREEVEPEQHEVPRRLEPRSPGVWPSSVAEPGPRRSDRSLRHSSGGVGRGSGVLPALLPHSPSAGGQEEGRGGGTDEEAGGSGAVRDAHGSRVADAWGSRPGQRSSVLGSASSLCFVHAGEEEEEEEGEEEASSNFIFCSRCSQSEIWCFSLQALCT